MATWRIVCFFGRRESFKSRYVTIDQEMSRVLGEGFDVPGCSRLAFILSYSCFLGLIYLTLGFFLYCLCLGVAIKGGNIFFSQVLLFLLTLGIGEGLSSRCQSSFVVFTVPLNPAPSFCNSAPSPFVASSNRLRNPTQIVHDAVHRRPPPIPDYRRMQLAHLFLRNISYRLI